MPKTKAKWSTAVRSTQRYRRESDQEYLLEVAAVGNNTKCHQRDGSLVSLVTTMMPNIIRSSVLIDNVQCRSGAFSHFRLKAMT